MTKEEIDNEIILIKETIRKTYEHFAPWIIELETEDKINEFLSLVLNKEE